MKFTFLLLIRSPPKEMRVVWCSDCANSVVSPLVLGLMVSRSFLLVMKSTRTVSLLHRSFRCVFSCSPLIFHRLMHLLMHGFKWHIGVMSEAKMTYVFLFNYWQASLSIPLLNSYQNECRMLIQMTRNRCPCCPFTLSTTQPWLLVAYRMVC